MRPSVEYFKEKFDVYNKLCFEGKLPMPPIRINTRYIHMGITQVDHILSPDGKKLQENVSIEMSVRRDLTEDEYRDILVHEMIHYYIIVNHLHDDSPHGKLFRAIMNKINSRYGFHVTVDFNPSEEALVKTISDRYRYVCVMDFDDGRTGLAIVPRGKVWELWDQLPCNPHIRNVKWFASNRAIFEKFPTFVRPGGVYVEADKLIHYLTGAVELEKQGNEIYAKK